MSSDARSVGLVKFRDPYPFGVDPSWRGSRSELPFLNSLKMKMSILLGVAQMNLGIIISYFNARFFGSSIDIKYFFIFLFLFFCLSFLSLAPTSLLIADQLLKGRRKRFDSCILLLGTSLCRSWSFLTVCLGIFHFLLSSSGALALKQTSIMWWFICFLVPLMILVKINCSGVKDHFRHNLNSFLCYCYVYLIIYG